MSETWSSLLAGVVGAIVGGLASLAGTMLVNKQQMATNARMRMYDELLPRLESVLDPLSQSYGQDYVRALFDAREIVSAVGRACAITSRRDRAASHRLMSLWLPFSLERPLKETPEWTKFNSFYFTEQFKKRLDELRVRYPTLGVKDNIPGPEPSVTTVDEAFYDPHNEDWDSKRRDDAAKLRDEVHAFSGYLGAKLG